jgi:hypothetical protein
MAKFPWEWHYPYQPLRWEKCFAFVALRVFQLFPRVVILVLLGQEFLVNLEA